MSGSEGTSDSGVAGAPEIPRAEAAVLGAWVVARLTDERARAEWRDNLAAAWGHLLEQPLERVLPKAEAEVFLRAHLADEARLESTVTFAVRALLVPALGDMRKDEEKVGRFIPEEARSRLLALVSEKGVIQPAWIASIFRERAVEALVSDTLYRALIDFSTIVPRLLQSMTPLGRFAKLGGFGEGGIGTRIVEELEKRLEPEIRRFLDLGTRKALDGAARFSIDHLDDANALEFRRHMVGFALDQTGSFHAAPLTDARVTEVESIARQIARHVACSDAVKAKVAERVAEIAARSGAKPLRGVLAELGVKDEPPFDVWAEASFPVLRQVLAAPAVTAWLGRVASEMLEHFGARNG